MNRPDDPSNPFQVAWALSLARWSLDQLVQPRVNKHLAFLICNDQPVVIFTQYNGHGNSLSVRVLYSAKQKLSPRVLGEYGFFDLVLAGSDFSSCVVDFSLSPRDQITIEYCRGTNRMKKEILNLTSQMPSLRDIDRALNTKIEPSPF
jgi:hypothetical protein